jgi:MOSC domain-containing protein YiiM
MDLPEIARHPSDAELEAGLSHVRAAPRDRGRLELIVRRPGIGRREVLTEGLLDADNGLVGDTWSTRRSFGSLTRGPHPNTQVTVMNARAAALVSQRRDRWPLAGDQLFVDLDLSEANLPAGTRLSIGSAIIEVSVEPHMGCRKFVERFGIEAMKFVNGPLGRTLRLRGLNARVVTPGVVTVGDEIVVLR